jgi:Fe-S-cluster containining protein
MPVEREPLRLQLIEYTCSKRCMGHPGNNGGCCTLDDRDWIIGPVLDEKAFLADLSRTLGRPVKREEALIDYEEGRRLFPERSMWQVRAHYPAMRVRADLPRNPCVYYEVATGACGVHAIRPALCRDYQCDHLKHVTSFI